MRNYIRAELFRNFRRKGYWIFNAICCSLIAVMYGILIYNNYKGYSVVLFEFMLTIFLDMVPMTLLLMPVFVEFVTYEESKNLTLKNVVSHGLQREKIFISKLIASSVLGAVSAAIVIAFYCLVGLVFLKQGEQMTADFVLNFAETIAMCVPLWVGTISICSLLALLFKSNSGFSLTYVVFLLASPKIAEILITFVSDKFVILYENLPLERMYGVSYAGMSGTGFSAEHISAVIIVGALYTLISAICGVLLLKKAEMK